MAERDLRATLRRLLKPVLDAARTPPFLLKSWIHSAASRSASRTYCRNPRVNVLVPLFNRGTMLRELLRNLLEIERTHDDANFRLVVGDFRSDDIEPIERMAKALGIRAPVTHLLLDGAFSKTRALTACVEHPQIAPDEIVFICDVDLKLPLDVFSRIRRHTRAGRTFYCPVISLEREDKSLYVPRFDHKGTGFVACFKSDFQRSGGFSDPSMAAKTTWGGEDDYLFERLRKVAGLSPYRYREPDIVSKWHPREGSDWYGDRARRAWD